MKKIMMFALAAAMLCACAKNEDVPTVAPQPEDGAPVILTFGGSDQFTRAFFDNVAAAEPWEKKIVNMTVYAFNSSGRQVMRKQFSADDIAAMRTEFVVPGLTAGETLTFYVLANRNVYYPEYAEERMLTEADTDSEYYNANFDMVSKSHVKMFGFSMSGKATATMNTDGTMNNVSITLKRFVAKVAVKIGIDPTLSQRYHDGKLYVTSIDFVSPAASSIWFFDNYTYRGGTQSYRRTFTQTPKLIDGEYCSLFYTFEQGVPAYSPDEKSQITIKAVFDQDSSLLTIGDQINYTYTVELEGSGDGEIRRNGYYRVSATITDLDALHTRSAFEVSEWESPATEDFGDIIMND